MLIIRTEQLKAFEQDGWRRFEDEMTAHSRAFAPRLSKVLGEEQLRVAVRSGIRRAVDYGFTNRGPIRLFLEMMFLCGSGFDTDPQYPEIRKTLQSPDDQMRRAERIHFGYLDYLENVAGPGARNVRKALQDLLVFAQMPISFSHGSLEENLLDEMNRIFPQKVDYVGEAGLRNLIREGIAEANRHGFRSPRAQAMIIVLMFAFGHGCTQDPLYPWISRTLQDRRIVDSTARAKRLEKKSVTWLGHVVAWNSGRGSRN